MTTELVINEPLKGLDESKSKQIEAVFSPMVEMLKGFEQAYDEVTNLDICPDTCKRAKRLRIDISKVRTSADKLRKQQKEEYIRAGKAIQGVYNILDYAVRDKENNLKNIETHYERIEAERIAKIESARIDELSKYGVDGSTLNLGNMADDVWNNFLSGTKTNYEAVKAAEEKAENDRIEAENKRNLENKRRYQCSRLVDYIPNFETMEFSGLSEEEYISIVNIAKKKREVYEIEQENIRLENEKLKREAEDRKEKEKQRLIEEKQKREKENAPDKEKLTYLLLDLDAIIESLSSDIARKSIRDSHNIISKAINELEK